MEYGAKFIELNRFGRHLVDTEQRKVDRFEDGLDIEIRKGLSSEVFTKYQDVYQRVMQVEKILNESKAKNARLQRNQVQETQLLRNKRTLLKKTEYLNQLQIRRTVNSIRKFIMELNATERPKSASTVVNLAIQLPSAPNRMEGLLEA